MNWRISVIITIIIINRYVGRAAAASTATGNKKQHTDEQNQVIVGALAL